jgi:hypothetical protein
VQVMTGPHVLDVLAARLDDLHCRTETPITARRPWLSAWQDCFPQYAPIAVVLEHDDGRLEGAALLARCTRFGVTQVVAMGHGPSDQTRLAVRSAEAAERLGVGLAEFLHTLPGPWRLALRHLPRDDAVATVLTRRLRHAHLADGDVSPVTRFTADRRLRSYVSRNHHQQVQRLHNRINREGLTADIAHLRNVKEVAPVLGEVEAVCRSRDVEVRGWSALDDGHRGPFFRRIVMDLAQREEVELTTLRLNGQLAAYVLCFRDAGAYRMWSCRVAPAWRRYGAGRLANNAALAHALADGHSTEFDWMRGEERYKQSMANHIERAVDLRAWSSPGLMTAAHARRRLTGLLNNSAIQPAVQPVASWVRFLKHAGPIVRRRVGGAR